MQHSLFHRLGAVTLFAALSLLHACQKDNTLITTATQAPDGTATPRYTLFYGVTVYSASRPSRIIEIDEATGVEQNIYIAKYGSLDIDDIKGICYLGSGIKYAITTGPNNAAGVPNNALLTLNITTMQTQFVSTSTLSGPVSDIDYDPIAGEIYGLLNNTSNVVRISGGSLNTYSSVGIGGLPAGTVASGLTLFGDINTGIQANIAVETPGLSPSVDIYKVNPTTGATGFIANVLPFADFTGANLGMGFQLTGTNQMYLNRNASTLVPGPGLSQFGWPPAGATANFTVYGAAGRYLEDLSSDIGI